MLCRKDPCGIVCITLTYAMLLHCVYVILFVIIVPQLSESFYGTLNALILCAFVSLSIVSHGRAAYFDPGFVPLPKKSIDFSDVPLNENRKPNGEGSTVCNRCDSYRPARSHHCRICRRCVRRMDHHCPWINNCVGEFNQKYFILFLFYIGVTSIYAVSFIIWALIALPNKSEAQIVHSIVICIESCLFGLFVVTIFIEQIHSIISDRTLIDSLKADDLSRSASATLPPSRVLFSKVFGPGPIIFWLFPCDVQRSTSSLDSQDVYNV